MFKSIVLLLLLSLTTQAALVVWPLGLGFRFERDENQGLKAQSHLQMAAGLEVDAWNFEVLRSQFSSSTSEGNTSIKRDYQDFSAWAGYSLYDFEDFKLIASAGLGFFDQKVITQISGFQDTGSSNQEFMTGLAAEARWVPFANAFVLSGGARLFYSQSLDPELQPDVFVRVGVKF